MSNSHYFVVYKHGTVQYVDYFRDYLKAQEFYEKKKKNLACHNLKLILGEVKKKEE